MAEDNNFIDSADNIYFEDVEGEQGKSLKLEEDQVLKLTNAFISFCQR